VESLSQRLARHVLAVRYEDLPPSVVAATKASLLDAIGVTLAASGIGEGCDAFVDLARESGGRPESLILGHGFKVAARDAALANGAMAHALDFEDAFDGAPLHPNAPVIPALLALAQARGGVSGKDLITALAVGCDLVCRIGLCLTAPMEKRGWYPPPMFGAYGAAAVSSRLLSLTEAQVLDAFSLTLCQSTCSGELKSSPRSLMRAVRDSFAAQAGVVSAQLAKRGVIGFDLPFEGKAGFFNLYADGAYDPDVLTGGLGQRFYGEDVSFKAWPACRGTHAFIEASLDIRREPGFAIAEVVSIHGEGLELLWMLMQPQAQKRAPKTAIDAKFSLPFTIAAALIDGAVTLDSFTPAMMARTDILALAERVDYATVPDWGQDRMASGRLEVRMADGTVHRREILNAFGHPTNPIGLETLVAKFKDCGRRAAKPYSDAALDRLAERILSIETLDDAGAGLFDGLDLSA